jgi:hypothetical protein
VIDSQTGYDDYDPRDAPEPEDVDTPAWMNDPKCDRCGRRRDDLREKGREFICPDCIFDAQMEAVGDGE